MSFDSISGLSNIVDKILKSQAIQEISQYSNVIPESAIDKIIKSSSTTSKTLLLIVSLLGVIIGGWIRFSLVKLSLQDLNNQNTKFKNIFKFKAKLFVTYILALIGYGIVSGLSFIFAYMVVPVFLGFLNQPESHIISFGFIVVLLIAALIFGFTIMYSYILTPFIVVDKETSVKDAFSLSKKITSGSRIKIFIFDLLLMLLGIILTLGQFLLFSLVHKYNYLENSYIASFLTLAIYSFISITIIFIGIFGFTYIYQILLRDYLIKTNNKDVQESITT